MLPSDLDRWFRMHDLLQRPVTRATWIPLQQVEHVVREGEFPNIGFREEFHGVATAMFAPSARAKAMRLDYSSLLTADSDRPLIEGGRFRRAGETSWGQPGPQGRSLVLVQRFEGTKERSEWHLDQDLLLGLRLGRKGHTWVAPDGGGVGVAKLMRSSESEPLRIDKLAEWLEDFFSARRHGLVVSSFMSRTMVLEDLDGITFAPQADEEDAHNRWLGMARAINKAGFPHGVSLNV